MDNRLLSPNSTVKAAHFVNGAADVGWKIVMIAGSELKSQKTKKEYLSGFYQKTGQPECLIKPFLSARSAAIPGNCWKRRGS